MLCAFVALNPKPRTPVGPLRVLRLGVEFCKVLGFRAFGFQGSGLTGFRSSGVLVVGHHPLQDFDAHDGGGEIVDHLPGGGSYHKGCMRVLQGCLGLRLFYASYSDSLS